MDMNFFYNERGGLFYGTDNRIRIIEEIKRAKEAINNGLQITWETDLKKMQFEKLRSYNGMEEFFKQGILRIDEFDILKYCSSPESIEDLISNSDPSCLEMINILLDGGKLIPPAVVEHYAIVDGQEKKVKSPGCISLNDGNHRIRLARVFGLEVIPVVVFKECSQYWFSPDKWSFEGPRIREEQQHEGGFSWEEYNGLRATSADGKVFTFKDHLAFIDDSNADYIVIQTRNE